MTDPPRRVPDLAELDARVRKLRLLLWPALIVGVLALAYLVTWLGPLAVRFPAASVPALLGAMFGYYQAHRRGLGFFVTSAVTDDPPIQQYTILWGIIIGAFGYAAFASVGVGVPAPEAALGWRLFGGLVFGAAAGAAAGAFLPLVALPVQWIWERLQRRRAA